MLDKTAQCPQCGSPVSENGLWVGLRANVIRFGGHVVDVNHKVAELAFALNRRAPEPVEYDQLIAALWGHLETPNPRKNLAVYASLLRKALRPLGFTVIAYRGIGYALDRLQPMEQAA